MPNLFMVTDVKSLKKKLRLVVVLIVAFFIASVMTATGQEMVRAKVGMEILQGDEARLAKTMDRIKAGNELRLLVVPEKESYVYVINSDHEHANLMNKEQIQDKYPGGALKIFPSLESLYKPDGKGKQENFVIVCSLTPLGEITGLFASGQVSYDSWRELEDKLTKRSKITLGEKVNKPFAIAGTVRGGPKEENLKIFSGNDLLVKRYQFQLKK